MKWLIVIVAICILLIASGCAMNFGTGTLVQNTAGAQVSSTDEAMVDGSTATDGGTDVMGGEADPTEAPAESSSD